MILNVSCDNLTKSKSEDTEESDSKSKKKKRSADDEDVAADDENNDDSRDSRDSRNDDEYDSRDRDRSSDDSDDSGSEGWTRAEKKEFMDNCVENTGFSQSKAESYCDCMLKKLQSRYPKSSDMSRASDLKGEITDMAPGCLN